MVDPLSYFSFLPGLHNWFNKEGRKEMLYLMMHIKYILKVRKNREVLFNDALNTFYLRLYGGHMVKDLSVREETHCCHISYSFQLAASVLFYMHHLTDRIKHTLAFVTLVMEH